MKKKLNKRKCKSCGEVFQKLRPLQYCCSAKCSIDYANKLKEIKEKKNWKKKKKEWKEKLKTKSEHLKEAQVIFNKWIRLSKKQECVSCGKDLSGKKFDAGHYRSVGNAPALRFEEDNVWPQCVHCNQHLSANLIEYRISLVSKIGVERVEWLEKEHEPKKYSIEDIENIKKIYKDKLRTIKK